MSNEAQPDADQNRPLDEQPVQHSPDSAAPPTVDPSGPPEPVDQSALNGLSGLAALVLAGGATLFLVNGFECTHTMGATRSARAARERRLEEIDKAQADAGRVAAATRGEHPAGGIHP